MTNERNGDQSGHRLFHAMVLMGGSLALGCGGMSNETGDEGVGGSGASPGSAGTASTGAGGAGNGGVGASGGTTGVSGSAGAISIPTAGTSSMPPDPPNCPATQWECDDSALYCRLDTYLMPDGTGCECDETRPVSASDCPPGNAFVCHAGGRNAEGQALPQVVPFSCACVPDTSGCDTECNAVAPSSGSCTEIIGPNVSSALCNCAVVVLR
jgi:hypothetical protein